MTIHKSQWAKGVLPIPFPAQAGQVTAYRATFTVPTTIAEGDIIDLFVLPPGCFPVAAKFDSDDLDTDGSPAIVWDVGLMTGKPGDDVDENGDARTCGDELFDGITTSQAGGVVASTEKDGCRIAPADDYRSFGAKLVTDADAAAAGDIGLTVFYVAGTN